MLFLASTSEFKLYKAEFLVNLSLFIRYGTNYDFDNIDDSSKKEWLLHTLNLRRISFHTTEHPQTVEEYNKDLKIGNSEIDAGDFITAYNLKQEAEKW